MSDTKVEIKQTTLTEIFAKTENWGWARVLIEETGRVIVVSDYGEWSYCWWSIGNKTIYEFLASLDSQYMGGKFLGAELHKHSDKNTIQAIRESILFDRQCGEMTKAEAADEWATVKSYEDAILDYRTWCEEQDYWESPWEFGREEVVGTWDSFWNKLWTPHIVPALKGMAEQKALEEVSRG